jgi:hypothetical protein
VRIAERHRRAGRLLGFHPRDIGWTARAFSRAISICLAATTASPCVSYANATSGLPLSSVMLKPQPSVTLATVSIFHMDHAPEVDHPGRKRGVGHLASLEL